MQLHLELSAASGRAADLLDRFTSEVARILGTTALVAGRHSGVWSMRVTTIPGPTTIGENLFELFDSVVSERGVVNAILREHGGQAWTVAGLGASPPAVLLLKGNWTSQVGALSLLAGDLTMLWRIASAAPRERARRAVYRLARLLPNATTHSDLAHLLIREMARAVRARIGSLAISSEHGAELSIAATHGYRRELVEHIRVRPGAGVLGTVFETGRTILESGLSRPGRSRYRTRSFIAVPIKLGRQTLAVASVTDRRDNAPFTDDDAMTLRELAAPAALALSRAQALSEAHKFAQTAAIDPGSGVFNRRYLQTRIDEELQRSRRHGAPVSLVMLDLDNFKSINDSFGHLAGDTVIKDVAQILRRSVRIFDVCARFGGEEFAILMPGASLDSATKIAARIRERIEAYRIADPRLAELRVTASLGLAVSFPDITSQDLVERADAALYLAKREGKNRLRVLPPEVHATPSPAGNRGIG
jgi:diguanylate cyclase (GGDEF)-like protein